MTDERVLPNVLPDKLETVRADMERAKYKIVSEVLQADGNWTITYRLPDHADAGPSVNALEVDEIASPTGEFDSAPETVSEQAPDAAAGGEIGDDEVVIPPFSVTNVKKMFPGAKVENIRANLPLILCALQARGLTEPTMVLYSLATLRAENGGFLPKSEVQGSSNTPPGGPPFGKYDGRLGNSQAGDGERFRGRGFIQLTGRDNYKTIGAMVDLDLVNEPDLASDPEHAAAIFAAFIGTRQTMIRTALAKGDLETARKAVNGGHNGMDNFRPAYVAGEKMLASMAAVA